LHELSITESILSITLEQAKQANAVRVSRVNLIVGELAGVVDECVDFYFQLIAKDTVAEGAELSFEHPPTRFRCRDCGNVFVPEGQNWTCPGCGKKDFEIISGRDLHIDSIEVE
jgi:hydrogenase nickel incorporation protein HypA/HybF